jgi:diguanylate cyclase (GGDEF)-like protein/PAS domain S-box-containing protein
LAGTLPDWQTVEAETGENGLKLLETIQPHCILLDFRLPDMDGLEVLRTLGNRVLEIPTILITGQGDETTAVEALKSGVRDYLVKDTAGHWLTQLPQVLEQAIGNHQREMRELREREARMRLLLESTGDGIYGVDGEGCCTFANRACLDLLGYDSAEELIGSDIHGLIHHHHADGNTYPADACQLGMAWRLGEGMRADDDTFWRRDGSSFSVDYASLPMRDSAGSLLGHVVSFRDISERKKNSERLARLARTYAVLSACNHDLVHSTSEKELVDRFCDSLVRVGGYALAWIALLDDTSKTPHVVAHAGHDAGFDQRLCADLEHATEPGLAVEALRQGHAIHAQIPHESLCFSQCSLNRRGCSHEAVAALPLLYDGIPLGILTLYADQADAFDDQAMRLLEELASDLAFGLNGLRSKVARAKAEAALLLHDHAIQAASNGIMIVAAGKDGLHLIYANPAFERITGYSLAEVLGRNPVFLAGVDQQQLGLETIRSAIQRREAASALLLNYRKDGTSFWNDLHIAPVVGADGEASHFVGILNDVTDRVQYERELEYQAAYDTLTGLPNRNLLEDRLNQALAFSERHQSPFAVLFMDLDRFKMVNDNLGHHAGDELLKIIGRRLAKFCRDGDTVARFGGDEFVIILTNLEVPGDLEPAVRRLRTTIAEPVSLQDMEIHVTASIGAAFFPEDGQEVETLMRCADIAMFRAKDAGGNVLHRFSAEMGGQLSERMRLEGDLRHALEREELFPHFQPQIDLGSGRIIGIEALARWHHPERGPISPALFIPLAEETGLIQRLGVKMLEMVCRQAAAWRSQGWSPPAVAVNLSPYQLANPAIAKIVAEILQRTGMPGHGLELEVTESALMGNPELALDRLRQLKALGIELSLDDFGTGYSSLSYLKRFPFDRLKIDQSFIRDIPGDSNDSAITITIINMAHSLGLKAVAEGVEKQAQHDFLVARGCDHGQGWFYGKPTEAAGMDRFM